jgi:hypothetical protein
MDFQTFPVGSGRFTFTWEFLILESSKKSKEMQSDSSIERAKSFYFKREKKDFFQWSAGFVGSRANSEKLISYRREYFHRPHFGPG